MKPISAARLYLILLLLSLVPVLATGCAQPAEEASAESTVAEVAVPAPVSAAHEAALEFLRTSANHCVPPEGVHWQIAEQGDMTPVGFSAYRFSADNCRVTIAYSQGTEPTAYHVSLTNDLTGFCWQAVVDDHGQIVRTGVAADIVDAGNPAAAYCYQQGHSYEIRTLASGQLCGACVFEDGSACKGWDFFYGDCAPGDNPTAAGSQVTTPE